jgi:hypothetical protein
MQKAQTTVSPLSRRAKEVQSLWDQLSVGQQTELLTFDLRLLYARATYTKGKCFSRMMCHQRLQISTAVKQHSHRRISHLLGPFCMCCFGAPACIPGSLSAKPLAMA